MFLIWQCKIHICSDLFTCLHLSFFRDHYHRDLHILFLSMTLFKYVFNTDFYTAKYVCWLLHRSVFNSNITKFSKLLSLGILKILYILFNTNSRIWQLWIWQGVTGSGCLLECSAGRSHVDNLSKFTGWSQGVATGLHLLGFCGKWTATKRRAC